MIHDWCFVLGKQIINYLLIFRTGAKFELVILLFFRLLMFLHSLDWYVGLKKKEEGYPKLRVSWLYRPADIKLSKGIQLNAAPNEIFYSFHQDEASAVSLLHPCKVAFLRKGTELPAGISSFVCRRVYDIDNKCLWWLTDQDYINVSSLILPVFIYYTFIYTGSHMKFMVRNGRKK